MNSHWMLLPIALVLGGCSGLETGGIGRNREVALSVPQSGFLLAAGEMDRFEKFARHAKRDGNREICGMLLLNVAGKIEVDLVPNASASGQSFAIAGRDRARTTGEAKSGGRKVVGTFHSHPRTYAVPSLADLQGLREGEVMMIYGVATGRVRLWQRYRHAGRWQPRELELEVEQVWQLSREERRGQRERRAGGYVPGTLREPTN